MGKPTKSKDKEVEKLVPGLYVVGTPIGNLKDITLRAIETLKSVDVIACEDTRVSQKLLNHYGISKPLISYHEHNKEERSREIIRMIEKGKRVALISDAGMPGISDPGFYIIREMRRHGLQVTVIPGPTAFVAALVVSGLPTDKFVYEGFLPRREGRRRKRLEQLKDEPRTIVFYESPYRVVRLLNTLLEILGDRHVFIARELTKKFEQFIYGKISEVIEHFDKQPPKGEFVVIVEGKAQWEKSLKKGVSSYDG